MPRAVLRLLLIACLFLPALAPAAPLRVVMDQNYPPYSWRNSEGKLEGYTVDLWRLWQQKTGTPVEIIPATRAQALPMLESGKADVVDPVSLTPARVPRFDFSPSYGVVSTDIYAAAPIGGIHDLRSLRGFQVGVQQGDACAEHLERAGITGLQVFPTYEALLGAASRQELKLLCLDENSAEYQLYRLGLHRSYVKAFEVTRDQLRRAVRKGDSATLALVERGMAQVTQAERDALHDKWMGRPVVPARYAERLVQVLVALGALVLLLAAWLASVRRAVRSRTHELERQQAQLRTLFESSPDLIWLKDRDGVYQACNAKTADVFGHARDGILGKRDADLLEPETAQAFARDDAAAIRAGGPVTFEETAPPGPWEQHVFETIKTPVRQSDGTVLGVLGVARDISERRAQERTIREQQQLLKEMSSLAQIGAWEIDLATDGFQWTDELARIYEIPPGLPVTPATCTACYDEDDRVRIGRTLDAAATRGKPFTIELEMVSGAGKRKWVRSICSAILADGKPVKLRGTVQDVTQRRDLEESMRMATLIYQTSLEAIVVTDEENRIVDANPAFTRQTGGELRDVTGTRPALFASTMHDSGFYERLWQALLEHDHWQGEILDRNQDGSFTAKYVDIRVIRHPDGRVHRHVVQFHDISEQKQKDELIWRQTNFDVLTGLPNRCLFLDRLEQDLRKAQGAGQGLGVLLLDLDRFKDINDSYGHAMGDNALVEMTRRLAHCVSEDATIARLGGNMFAVAVSEFDGQRHLDTIADAVIGAIAEPLKVGGELLAYVSASVGISVYPDDGQDAAELVTDADHVIRCLDALHGAGARVSIDDFGTGFSSLSYLKHFDVDYLKIDKSFIDHLTEDGPDRALTEAIVDLAHRLGIEAIAEGVETGAQRDILAALGCDYIQGYVYSPAVAREAFEQLLERQMVH